MYGQCITVVSIAFLPVVRGCLELLIRTYLEVLYSRCIVESLDHHHRSWLGGKKNKRPKGRGSHQRSGSQIHIPHSEEYGICDLLMPNGCCLCPLH
ncbi:hypothetical protein HOY80DRAFT_685524 [Tuber brumale]|nr:hypothetical protein HOY80DRAFT_685524 [Tuber brumale]